MSDQNKGTPIHGSQTQSQPGRHDQRGSSGQKQGPDSANKDRQNGNPGSRGKDQQQQNMKDDADSCGCETDSEKDETKVSEDTDQTSGRGGR